MKIRTGTGDDGLTSLSGGKRVPKFSPRVEAYGSVDEIISWIGLLRDFPENSSRRDLLIYVQDQLMKCAASLSVEKDKKSTGISLPDPDCISIIENEINSMESKLPELSGFVLPGGHIIVSYCHIARCVCRRVERAVLRLNSTEEVPEIIPKFLNRLSDYLFVLSRQLALELDIQDIRWPF